MYRARSAGIRARAIRSSEGRVAQKHQLAADKPRVFVPGMEHRWGERVPAKLPLSLVSGDLLEEGILLNASVSGAYVATSASLKRDRQVFLQFRPPLELKVRAFVARADDSGIAVEWCEFAGDSVRALLLVTRNHI